MVFDFTFTIPVSLNPFARAATDGQPEPFTGGSNATSSSILPRRPFDGPIPSTGARKRGWMPAPSRALEPNSLRAEARGYVDTPSRYVGVQGQDMAIDLPLAKRRRTIGSTVADIVNFALRRSEADMTAYEIWRDGAPGHGLSHSVSDSVLEQPPPYEDVRHHSEFLNPESFRKPRRRPTSPASGYHGRANLSQSLRPSSSGPVGLSSLDTPHRPDDEESNELDDQIVRMESRLQAMIAEGQKALGQDIAIADGDQVSRKDMMEDEHTNRRDVLLRSYIPQPKSSGPRLPSTACAKRRREWSP